MSRVTPPLTSTRHRLPFRSATEAARSTLTTALGRTPDVHEIANAMGMPDMPGMPSDLKVRHIGTADARWEFPLKHRFKKADREMVGTYVRLAGVPVNRVKLAVYVLSGLFAGVAASGLALVCVGAARGRPLASVAGGLLLGSAIFLSYGLVLFGVVVLVAVAVTVRMRGLRRVVVPWLVATAGVVAVAAVHLVYGFSWLNGLAQLRIRYYQGIASQRPFAYFVYANFAAWLFCCSPLLAVGLARAVGVLRRRETRSAPDRVAALISLAGLTAAVLADVSALSKAETERIWLAFGVAASTGLALLRGRVAVWALLGCGVSALLVNHLLYTGW